MSTTWSYRAEVRPDDRAAVRDIVTATGFFHPPEIDIAVELVDERLAKGVASGYHFVFAEQDGQTVGYSCFGPIPCTAASYDLYWIAVHPSQQGRGLGRALMLESERHISHLGGRRIYVDTSNRPQYLPTRTFYERCGYQVDAVLKDFYDIDDDKVIFVKVVS